MEFKLNYNGDESSKVFFTSDTHFGHKNILEYCKRPYSSVEEMNEVLIKNWNEVVPEDGIIFHLGDFAFGGSTLFNSILPRLNGTKVLILGNHDNKNFRKSYGKYFAEITSQLLLTIDGRQVYLNHYPFLCYGGYLRNPENAVWQLYGHVHSGPNSSSIDTDKLNILSPYQYDVGVDNNDYKPVSWEYIKYSIQHKVDQPIIKLVNINSVSRASDCNEDITVTLTKQYFEIYDTIKDIVTGLLYFITSKPIYNEDDTVTFTIRPIIKLHDFKYY